MGLRERQILALIAKAIERSPSTRPPLRIFNTPRRDVGHTHRAGREIFPLSAIFRSRAVRSPEQRHEARLRFR
ncbi:MAG: hypothetical protein B7X42_00960 [Thiomonas sp. 14-66-4]|nr:MAG: hypothetical protein B7X42_00960 [Thiomonas sp. 14-66-4]